MLLRTHPIEPPRPLVVLRAATAARPRALLVPLFLRKVPGYRFQNCAQVCILDGSKSPLRVLPPYHLWDSKMSVLKLDLDNGSANKSDIKG